MIMIVLKAFVIQEAQNWKLDSNYALYTVAFTKLSIIHDRGDKQRMVTWN